MLNLNLGLASTLNLMAGIYWREGDLKKSTETLELALDIFKQLGNKNVKPNIKQPWSSK